jgi:putative acetyltransferase
LETNNLAVNITIREEIPPDHEAVYRVNQQAFDTEAEAELVNLLRSSGKAVISLVAKAQGMLVGHILFSPVTIEPQRSNWKALGLAPVAVSPERQRQGIGKALVKSGIERCRFLGIELVVVLGHPEYYPKFGFQKASDFGISNEYQADEAFMVLELVPGTLLRSRGLVRYAPEFNELES